MDACIGETLAEARKRASLLPKKFTPEHLTTRGLLGTPETLRQRLQELAEEGVQEVILSISDILHRDVLPLFAHCLR